VFTWGAGQNCGGGVVVDQRCEFPPRRGRTKYLSAQKSNYNTNTGKPI